MASFLVHDARQQLDYLGLIYIHLKSEEQSTRGPHMISVSSSVDQLMITCWNGPEKSHGSLPYASHSFSSRCPTVNPSKKWNKEL